MTTTPAPAVSDHPADRSAVLNQRHPLEVFPARITVDQFGPWVSDGGGKSEKSNEQAVSTAK